jgi:23S rRNA (uracil1939-C5)-methyltransferase
LSEEEGEVTLKADCYGKVWSSARQGERFFIDKYMGTDLFFSPKAFSQANRHIAGKIAEKLGEWIGPVAQNTAFFDAYCGMGFFTFLLRQEFGIRVGMDTSRISIDCAKNTLKSTGLQNVKFYRGEAEQDFIRIFESLKRDVNVLLLDPPRAGIDKDFLDKIRQRGDIDSIYYVSCDPARLARDVKILTENSGWVLDKVAIFDMFPRTKHIETAAAFRKRK